MSPAGSAHADVLPGPGIVLGGPRVGGLLPKYPSNISSYSAGSGRSLNLETAVEVQQQQQQQQQQQLSMQHVQPGGEHWASHMAADAALAAAAAEAAGSRAPSGMGYHADIQQQQQQQHDQPSAGKTRPAAVHMGRASSGPVGQEAQPAAAAAAAAAAGPQLVSRSSETGAAAAAANRTPAGSGRAPAQRGVSFNIRQQPAQDGSSFADQEYVDLSPEAVAAAAAGLRAGLPGRPRSPAASYDDMQASWQHQGHHGLHEGGLDEEGYYAAQGAGLVRPHTAGSGASGQQQLRGTLPHPAGRGVQSTPTRNRSTSSSIGWAADGGMGGMIPHDASLSRQQQLQLQQQVLQVQAARLELQQQQLEIEQLLEQQQQQQQQQQAAGPGGIHSSIATLLQEHGLGTPSPTAAVGYSFDPSWVTHRADNPVPRGPVAGEFCSAFNLEQDPRFQVISKGGSGANRVEAELLSWVLSYSFDILGFITEAKQQGNPEVLAQALGTVHAQYSAVHDQLEQRIGELWARATYPNNPPLLEAIDRKRRGVGAGITLHSNITSVIEDLSRVQMQVAVKAAAQAVVSKRTDPPRNPGGGRGDPGGRGGGGRGGGRDGGREGGRDGGRGGGRAH